MCDFSKRLIMTKHLLRFYEFQDNVCGAAFFSSFVAIAQVSLILLFRFGMLNLGYRECFLGLACFAVVALLALLLLFSCPYHPKCDNRSSVGTRETVVGSIKNDSFSTRSPVKSYQNSSSLILNINDSILNKVRDLKSIFALLIIATF